MFESFGFSERYCIYRALLDSVQRNSATGFHNCDQGHPAYVMGRMGKSDYNAWGDSPEHNRLYMMMKELAESLHDCPDFRHDEFVFSWKAFCRLATDAYERARGVAVFSNQT
jgi:hypothetical protein